MIQRITLPNNFLHQHKLHCDCRICEDKSYLVFHSSCYKITVQNHFIWCFNAGIQAEKFKSFSSCFWSSMLHCLLVVVYCLFVLLTAVSYFITMMVLQIYWVCCSLVAVAVRLFCLWKGRRKTGGCNKPAINWKCVP